MCCLCSQCSSGLQAVASVAASIRAGFYTIGLAGGVETMSTNPMAWDGGINPKVSDNQRAQDCLLPMGMLPRHALEGCFPRVARSRHMPNAHLLLYIPDTAQCAWCTTSMPKKHMPCRTSSLSMSIGCHRRDQKGLLLSPRQGGSVG